MTAKSRKRKNMKKEGTAEVKTFRFFTNSKEVHIPAVSLNEARSKFQERYGYWPA